MFLLKTYVYKMTGETNDWLETFLNIYKIAQEIKVMLEMFCKHSS